MAGTDSGILARLARADDSSALVRHEQGREVLHWSFRELQQARQYAAQQLQAAGLRRGAPVLVLSGDLPQFVALFLACLDLQLCLLPLHPDQDQRSLRAILALQQPAAFVLDVAALQHLTLLQQQIACGFVLEPAATAWLCRLGSSPVAAPDTGRPQAAAVFHSSGSTGLPKAVYYDRARLETFLQLQRRLFEPFDDEAADRASVTPTPRINALPLTHWGGLSFCLQVLAEGRALHLPDNFAAEPLLQLLQRSGCRLLMLVPGMYRELLPCLQERCPPTLRYCLTMGEAMPAGLAATLRQRHGLLLCTAYGMSEALAGLAHGAVPWDELPPDSCGQLAFGEVQLVSPAGELQPASGAAEGELWIRNATTAACYHDSALLREKFVDGWYRSGDCFRRDAAGHYYFLTRLDAMCVHNGRNVYPQQVEAVLIEHEAVLACVAAALRLRDGRCRLGVALVLQPGLVLQPHELLDFYLQHGAHYAAPAFLLQVAALPMTPGGKPDRAGIACLLQEAYEQHSTAGALQQTMEWH
jgi:acyl-CoA synthetase (AMP-forming)/AMP-acid ligase II